MQGGDQEIWGKGYKQKPKWQLVQGLGPPALELDKSHSGRLYKPALRHFGVRIDPCYPPQQAREQSPPTKGRRQKGPGSERLPHALSVSTESLGGCSWSQIGTAISRFLSGVGDSELDGIITTWVEMRPLFSSWSEVRVIMDAWLPEEGMSTMSVRGGDRSGEEERSALLRSWSCADAGFC